MKPIQQFLLHANRTTLFWLVALPVTFNFYSSNSLILTRLVDGTQVLGGILCLIWINGICKQGAKALPDATSKHLKYDYVILASTLIVFAFLAAFVENVTVLEQHSTLGEYNLSLTISQPVWIPIVFFGAYFYLVYHTSRILTELKSGKMEITEMTINVLSLLFLLVGVFLIQPKVQQRLSSEHAA